MRIAVGIILVTGVFLNACAAQYPKPTVTRFGKDYFNLSYTGDLRTSHVIKKGDGYIVLTEPSADAAFSYDMDGTIDFSLLKLGSQNSSSEDAESSGSEDLPLTGRSPAVVLARELMYRTAEAGINYNVSSDSMRQMYLENLDVIEAVALAEAANNTHRETVNLNTGVTSSMSDVETAVTSKSTSETVAVSNSPGASKAPPQLPPSNTTN